MPTAALDVDRLRADTPGSARVNHLNNAGSALPPSIVVDTMVEHLRLEEEIGGYEAHAAAQAQIDAVYPSVAALLHSRPDQISLVESATSAWDRGFAALVHSGQIPAGSRILISGAEYASNVIPAMQMARHHQAVVEVIPSDAAGLVDVNALAGMLNSSVAAVLINHCPSQNGLINDAAAIGAAIRASGSGAWYVLDACQSVGQLEVDAPAIGADFLSATGRKFLRGPRGTGFLYSSDRALTELEPFPLDLHGATWIPGGYEVATGGRRYESWEKSYAAILGMGAAIDYALACGMPLLRERISALAEYARTGLAALPGIVVRDGGATAAERSGIVTITHDHMPAAELAPAIKARGVNVSLSTPDYSRDAFDTAGISGLVRISPHAYNTQAEIDSLIDIVAELTAY